MLKIFQLWLVFKTLLIVLNVFSSKVRHKGLILWVRENLVASICHNLVSGNWQLPRWHSDKPTLLCLRHAIKNLCGNHHRDNDDDDGDGRNDLKDSSRDLWQSVHYFTLSPSHHRLRSAFASAQIALEHMVLFNKHVTLVC